MDALAKLPVYDEYKRIRVKWLEEVPSHWDEYPICSKAKLKSITNKVGEDLLSVYLDKGVIRFDEVEQKRTNVTSLDLSKYQLVEVGDFVLNNQQAWRGSVGVSSYRGIVSPAYLVLSLAQDLLPNFANYLFRDGGMVSHYLISSKGVGTIQRNLYWPQLKRAPLFIPPVEEQISIANFLEQKTVQIDEAIAIKEKQIALLKERKQIIIQKAVTQGLNPDVPMKDSGVDWVGEIPVHWKCLKVSYMAKVDAGSTPDRGNASYWGGDIPWIKTGEVNYRRIERSEEYISKAGLRCSSLRLAPEGTLLMAMYGQGVTRGRVAILGVPATYNQACCAMTFGDKIKPEYAQYFFMAAYQYIRDGGNESSQMNISAGYISGLKMTVPPINEQEALVSNLNRSLAHFEQAESMQSNQIKKLKEYKATLINSAVTGKIKVA